MRWSTRALWRPRPGSGSRRSLWNCSMTWPRLVLRTPEVGKGPGSRSRRCHSACREEPSYLAMRGEPHLPRRGHTLQEFAQRGKTRAAAAHLRVEGVGDMAPLGERL